MHDYKKYAKDTLIQQLHGSNEILFKVSPKSRKDFLKNINKIGIDTNQEKI